MSPVPIIIKPETYFKSLVVFAIYIAPFFFLDIESFSFGGLFLGSLAWYCTGFPLYLTISSHKKDTIFNIPTTYLKEEIYYPVKSYMAIHWLLLLAYLLGGSPGPIEIYLFFVPSILTIIHMSYISMVLKREFLKFNESTPTVDFLYKEYRSTIID